MLRCSLISTAGQQSCAPSSSALLEKSFKRWATNLGGGNTQNGRDSTAKRLGIKLGNGAKVLENQIIIRQRGLQYWPGGNVRRGRDFTINAECAGIVHFSKDYNTRRTFVNVIPSQRALLPSPRPGGFALNDVSRYIVTNCV